MSRAQPGKNPTGVDWNSWTSSDVSLSSSLPSSLCLSLRSSQHCGSRTGVTRLLTSWLQRFLPQVRKREAPSLVCVCARVCVSHHFLWPSLRSHAVLHLLHSIPQSTHKIPLRFKRRGYRHHLSTGEWKGNTRTWETRNIFQWLQGKIKPALLPKHSVRSVS